MTLQTLCIHGHFYQPPREDPFSGFIPTEPGAEPFKNWNERIHAECYRPNADLHNFERISFNIGPTLFEWMALNHPQTSADIVHQDQENYRHYGVGNAIAQPFHHSILPLANRRDKETQVKWGIQQFIHRFKRYPQGMWLPETAVDLETLEVLAENQIKFTILAPWQSEYGDLDCTEPYRVELSQNKSISVFFYQRELSARISFDPQITVNADSFLQEYVNFYFNAGKLRRGEPQILLVASDGELYGHHQTYRDLFLARLVNGAGSRLGIQRIFPGLYLRKYPSRQVVTIRENTSWSCHHGVLRWRGDCSCIQSDGRWKAYLRSACDQLARAVDEIYASEIRSTGIDPWELRNRYISVLLRDKNIDALLTELAGRVMKPEEMRKTMLLLEAEHQCQRMYTSCGWFFDDFSRIEPKNCLAYAAQAVVLVNQAVGQDLTSEVLKTLSHVVSHKTGLRGDLVFNQQLERANLPKLPAQR